MRIGRYTLHEPLGVGGMATVHLGVGRGPAGFARPVAIKRLHPRLARDPSSILALFEEARLAARVQHANVVATLEVLIASGEPLIVLELTRGVPWSKVWSKLARARHRVDPSVACAVVVGLLSGLHAVHEVVDDAGDRLGLVHRDVSPQNVIVGADGIVRLADFGIARSLEHELSQRCAFEGKLAYLAPEAWVGAELDRRADLYACGVLLWEALTGERLFAGAELQRAIARPPTRVPAAISLRPELDPELSKLVDAALCTRPDGRFETAEAMAAAIERVQPLASARSVGRWIQVVAAAELEAQEELIAGALAQHERVSDGPGSAPPNARCDVGAANLPELA